MAAIVFKGLTKTYGTAVAVDNFSAEVQPGRVTGFLGPNGAGKSTLLRLCAGLLRLESGTGVWSPWPLPLKVELAFWVAVTAS